MEKEAEQDPSMWCDEWFAAVCAIQHEKRVQNVTDYSKKEGWSMERMCMWVEKACHVNVIVRVERMLKGHDQEQIAQKN